METSDFLREAVVRIEMELDETRKLVNKLDKNMGIWEAKISVKSQNQAATIAFFVAVALQIVGVLIDRFI